MKGEREEKEVGQERGRKGKVDWSRGGEGRMTRRGRKGKVDWERSGEGKEEGKS